MKRNVTVQKRAVIIVLVLLVLADVALAAYSWQLTSAPQTPQQQLAVQNKQLEVLRADIKRGDSIRQLTPAIQRDCERFEQSLLPNEQWVFVGFRGTGQRSQKGGSADRVARLQRKGNSQSRRARSRHRHYRERRIYQRGAIPERAAAFAKYLRGGWTGAGQRFAESGVQRAD